MAKKKNNKVASEGASKKRVIQDSSDEDEIIGGEDLSIDSAIIEDTFIEEYSEYNDVDNF